MAVQESMSRLGRISRSPLFVPALLLIIALLLFGGALFSSAGDVLSSPEGDVSHAFIYWRAFGFGTLSHNHALLWNPHVFSGAPFAANWLSALFYPVNWIYRILPIGRAVNVDIALHVWLTGLFMSLWAGRYAINPLARLLAGTSAMLGWPYYLHVYVGHLTAVDAMAWSPLILLAAERLAEAPSRRWVALAAFAVGMQILAGHPPTAICTAVAAILHFLIRLRRSRQPIQSLLALAAASVLSLGLSAIQLLPSLQVRSEESRNFVSGFGMTSGASLVVDSLVTSLVPGFFGDQMHQVYWGRMRIWETAAFVGVGVLSLACLAIVRSRDERTKSCWIMAGILLILALGIHSPIGAVLNRLVPNVLPMLSLNAFTYLMGLFVAVLAAVGLQSLIDSEEPAKPIGAVACALGAVIGLFGLWLLTSPVINMDFGLLEPMFVRVQATGNSTLPPQIYADPVFAEGVRKFTGHQCLIAAVILAALGLLYLKVHLFRVAATAIGVISIVELFGFAVRTTPRFPLEITKGAFMGGFAAEHPGDYRVLQGASDPAGIEPDIVYETGSKKPPIELNEESAPLENLNDMWGYDPYVLKRYRDLVAFTLGLGPNYLGDAFNFNKVSPFYTLLRTQYYFQKSGNQIGILAGTPAYPHALLVNRAFVAASRSAALQALGRQGFDPSKEVVLETNPTPAPQPIPAGQADLATANVSSDSGDSLTVDASTPVPALLLITDSYAAGWQASALPGSAQQHYDVLPADYALRAIPIGPGEHHIHLEYRSTGYERGRWITLTALALVGLMTIPGGRRKDKTEEESASITAAAG